MTTTIYNTYINALLADATYVHGLRSGSDLKDDLEKRMTPILADCISKNFRNQRGQHRIVFST